MIGVGLLPVSGCCGAATQGPGGRSADPQMLDMGVRGGLGQNLLPTIIVIGRNTDLVIFQCSFLRSTFLTSNTHTHTHTKRQDFDHKFSKKKFPECYFDPGGGTGSPLPHPCFLSPLRYFRLSAASSPESAAYRPVACRIAGPHAAAYLRMVKKVAHTRLPSVGFRS